MPDRKIRRALISVYDKTGIVDFARALVEEFGMEIISTGGTAALLKENNIPVTLVEEITGCGEMLDGRVKTLHPNIHAAILADRDNPEHMKQLADAGIEPIDMVVVNLYPFEKTIANPDCTFDEAIEMIDIGGPCLIRAAAKNQKHVLFVVNRYHLDPVLRVLRKNSAELSSEQRSSYARVAFHLTSRYDRVVHAYLECQARPSAPSNPLETEMALPVMGETKALRYGENPHQHALLTQYRTEGQNWPDEEPVTAQLFEDDMSFNNFVDADAALALCKELDWGHRGISQIPESRIDPPLPPYSCSLIKHTNPCGCAVGTDPVETYQRAYSSDPKAAMGGILAINFTMDARFASAVMETYERWGKSLGVGAFFLEAICAPWIEDDAEELIRQQKKWGQRVRLLIVGTMMGPASLTRVDARRISGGMLLQSRDVLGLNEDQWKVVTKHQPTDQQMNDLRLAWLICKHTKSNAITLCKDGMLIGNGAGQMSRVMSCRIATWLADENGHADKLAGSVAASDAFFPFRDGPDLLIEAGVTALIQPGGSKRDAETIAACDEQDVAMIFTGTRHFKH